MKWQLHRNRFTYTPAGLPVTLLCCAPGTWAELFPRFGLTEEESCQLQLCFLQQPEGFAALACIMAKYGSALRTLRIAVDANDGPRGAAAVGAAALLFCLIARGDLCQLKSLTLVDAGGARPGSGSFLSPLARKGAEPLAQLLTLRLALAGREAKTHLGCLAAFAWRGGLRNLRTLALLSHDDEQPEDADISQLLRAIIGRSSGGVLRAGAPEALVVDIAASVVATSSEGILEDGSTCRPSEAPVIAEAAPTCELVAVDLTGSGAGPATLEVLLELLEMQSSCRPAGGPPVTVQLEGTPAASKPEYEALYSRVQRLLPPRPS